MASAHVKHSDLASKRGKPRSLSAVVISHTHWDREWYLTQRQFQVLLGDTLDAVIDAVENEPGFNCFMADGQTSVIHDYLEIRPHRKTQIQRLICEGRLVIGPWYTMPDLWLPSGEALIRNLLRGRLDCERMGAAPQQVGYVPDSFGHIEQMPQILSGFGINNYFYSRGKAEHSENDELAFWWHGADASSCVLAHLLPGAYCNALMLPTTKSTELQERLESILRPYYPQDESAGAALLMNGIDHIWVQRDLPLAVAAAGALMPNVDFQIGSLESFNKIFIQNQGKRPLPVRTGCLRDTRLLPSHLHGTWSSRIDNKLENAYAGLALETLAEPLAAQLMITGGPDRRGELSLAWQLMLQNHAHDSICGCSMDAVHSDVSQRFRHVEEISEMVIADSLLRIAGTPDEPILLRVTGLAGSSSCCEFLVDLPSAIPVSVVDSNGSAYPMQSVSLRKLRRKDVMMVNDISLQSDIRDFEFYEHRMLALLPPAAPMQVQRFRLNVAQASTPSDPVQVTSKSLENKSLRIDVADGGTISIQHKSTGQVYHRMLELIDDADAGGGYSFLPLQGNSEGRSSHMQFESCATEIGPVRGTLRIRGRWFMPAELMKSGDQRSTERVPCDIELHISLASKEESINCRLAFANRAINHRIRLNLPLPFQTDCVDVERAFVVAHEDLTRFEPDPGQSTHPMRNWVAASNQHGGVAFVGRGLHEYSLENDEASSALRITLLRSVPFVDTCGSWRTPDAELRRELEYEFALLFFPGDWREGQVDQRAARYLQRTAAEAFGDYAPTWQVHPHASIRLEQQQNTNWVQVSSYRSAWRRHFGERDGWRTHEPENQPIKSCDILSVELEGEHLLLSCVKPAERAPEGGDDSSSDVIIRFYSLNHVEQVAKLQFGFPVQAVWQADLSEKPTQPLALMDGGTQISINKFEFLTLRVRPKRSRNLDAIAPSVD